MPNKIIVFDTETTGFNPNCSEIVQLSYILYDIDSQTVEFATKLEEDIVCINGHIPKKTSDIHGITKDRTLDKKPIEEHIDRFIEYFNEANQFIGHNIQFDIKMIIGQIRKIIKSNPEKKEKYQTFLDKFGFIGKSLPENAYCTMENSKVICSQLRGTKNPKKEKLVEVHKLLFQQDVGGELHNALVDISVTLRVYLKLTLDIDICETYDRTIKKQETVSNHNEICNIINPIPIIQPSKTTDYSGELITGFSDLPNDELEEKKIGVDSVIRETAVKTVYSIIKQSLKNVSKKIKPVDTDIIITICTAIIKSGKRKGETCGRPLNLCSYHKEKPKIFSRENIGKTSKIVPTEFGGKKNKTMKKNKKIKKGKLYKRKS